MLAYAYHSGDPMSALTFESILAAMNDETPSTKTASAPAVDTAASEQEMLDTVRTLTQSQKTAGAPGVGADAVATLSKIAQHTAAAEGVALEKQAQILGAALCDGFMVRLAGYDSAVAEKRANAGEVPPPAPEPYNLQMLMHQISELPPEAQAEIMAVLSGGGEQAPEGPPPDMKTAAAQYAQGQEDALQAIHKLASEIHLGGQQSAANVLASLR